MTTIAAENCQRGCVGTTGRRTERSGASSPPGSTGWWSRFHTRLVIALGVAWVLDGLEITIASNAEA